MFGWFLGGKAEQAFTIFVKYNFAVSTNPIPWDPSYFHITQHENLLHPHAQDLWCRKNKSVITQGDVIRLSDFGVSYLGVPYVDERRKIVGISRADGTHAIDLLAQPRTIRDLEDIWKLFRGTLEENWRTLGGH